MNLLIENTSFHNFADCINKFCKDENNAQVQYEDFLQLCIQIIFYEEINLSGLVPEFIKNQSLRFIDFLKNNYSINCIKFLKSSKNIDDIIKNVSYEYNFKLDTKLDKFKSITEAETAEIEKQLPKLDDDLRNRMSIYVEAINKNSYDMVINEYSKQTILGSDNYLDKIFIEKKEIFDKLTILSEKYGWNILKHYKLISDIRLETNKILSKENHKIYSPSVMRSRDEKRAIEREHESFLSKIYFYLEKGHIEIQYTKKIQLPSLKDYLINNGYGEPAYILRKAVELREVFSPIREYIKKEMKKSIGINSEQALNIIGEKICNDIKFGRSSDPIPVIENSPEINLKVISFKPPIRSPKAFLERNRINRCILGFTEIIGKLRDIEMNHLEKKLISNCIRN